MQFGEELICNVVLNSKPNSMIRSRFGYVAIFSVSRKMMQMHNILLLDLTHMQMNHFMEKR